jgi:multidrug efflux pump subunit AcrA (membrane-fusion protein)
MNELKDSDSVATAPHPSPNGDLRARVQKLRLGGPGQSGGGSIINRIAWLPWILCALLAITWAFVAVRAYRNSPKDDGEGAAAKKAAVVQAGTTTPVAAGTIQLEVKGYLVPARQFAVSPIDVGGKIIKLNFVEGMFYKEGEILAEIDPASYNAVVEETKAAHMATQSRLKAAEARLRELDPKNILIEEEQQLEQELAEAKANELRAKQEIDRLKAISNTTAVAAREVQQAQADYDAAAARSLRLKASLALLRRGVRQPKLDAAQADVEAARNDEAAAHQRLIQAQWRFGNCTIRMPIAATVLSKKAELYNLVNPLAFGATSGSICDVADLSDLEVDIEIPERDISKLKVGQACRVRADAFPERTYEGKLDRIMPIANRAKSIVNVRVKVMLPEDERKTPGMYLKPEMGAVVSFMADEKK